LDEGFQENLLRCFLNQTTLAEESTGNLEHARTITSDNLGKRSLISGARLARQFEVRRLFVAVRQKRFLIEVYGWRTRY